MQYAKLNNKDFILAHFDAAYPRIGKAIHIKNVIDINTIDDDNKHILDWVVDGYKGQDNLKTEIFFHLCSLGAKISLVQDSTFEKIMNILGASNYFKNPHAQKFTKYFDDYERLQVFLMSADYGKHFINNIDFNNEYAPHKSMILKNMPHFWDSGESAVIFCLHSFLSSSATWLNKKYMYVLNRLLIENSSLCLDNFEWDNKTMSDVQHCHSAYEVMQYLIAKDEKKEPTFSNILSEILILNDYNTLQSQLPLKTNKQSYIKI